MKRTLIIVGAVLGAILLVAGGIYLRARLTKPAVVAVTPVIPGGLPNGTGSFPTGTTTPANNGLPTTANNSIQSQAVDYAIQPDGSMIYLKTDGEIISVSDTSSTVLSTRKFTDLIDGSFSFDGRKVLLKTGDGSSPRWSVYDVQKNAWRNLSIEARDIRWSPQDYRVAYFSRRLLSQTLTILDLQSDSSKPRSTSATLNAEDLDLTWAGSGRILFGERASAAVTGSLWSFDIAKNTMKSFIDGGAGLEVLWGRNDQGLLFSSQANGQGGTLVLISSPLSAVGNVSSNQTLSFLTLPEKCSFFTVPASSSTPAAENLVCAIPRDIGLIAQAALPDDYQKHALVTEDNIYSIAFGAGTFTPLMNDPNRKVDATHLKIVGQKLYFINRADQKLYVSSLP